MTRQQPPAIDPREHAPHCEEPRTWLWDEQLVPDQRRLVGRCKGCGAVRQGRPAWMVTGAGQ